MTNTESTTVKTTPLHAFHLQCDAKMVPFAGYEMPVQFSRGIKFEHDHTRSSAGLFDISHMGQIRISGDNVPDLLETLVPGEIVALRENHQRYSVLTNDGGGIIDDLMITRFKDHFILVVNGACKDKDYAHLDSSIGGDCEMVYLPNALLALQGPKAASVLGQYVDGLESLKFLQAGEFEITGIPCLINRCGYTGEDGFEISVNEQEAENLARELLKHDSVEPIGLGARDSLRLEAGLCLYGHDIDETTSPIEAALNWVIAKKHLENNGQTARFPGAEKIFKQIQQGTNSIRTGLQPGGRMPVREGVEILNENGESIGRVTSGAYGQTVGGPIAMGYVNTEYSSPDTDMHVMVRNKRHEIYITSLPFVANKYYR